jgi:ABC-type branched-subunit amino acid transport system substrate-binding protein
MQYTFAAGEQASVRQAAAGQEDLMAEPIRIGWLGSALDGPGGGYDRIHRLAFEEAEAAGLLDRPVEFVLHPENGLPQGTAKNATDGFRFLVDEGCIGVAGAYSSDNAITVGPLANELQIPLISWCGTERLQGDYCFRLGNGDCGGDAALVVAWLERHGHMRVAVLSEVSPNGEEYFRFFRQECRRRGVSIAAVETVSQSPDNLTENLANLRRVDADALVYMGYGMLAAKGLLRAALDELGWDPPRIMGTAFMFYLMGFDKFEGWVGVDQLDPRNPLVEGFHDRYVARYGEDPPFWPNAIPVLAYDTARVLIEGLFRAPILSGPGLKAGLESIRFMPSTTGGARTHIACSAYEHGMFRGDWLLYGRVRNGELEFEGLFEP